MGYFIEITEAKCSIPLSKADAALTEMKRLNEPEFNSQKNGGSYGPNGKSKFWYSWMPESFDDFNTLDKFLEALGFDLKLDGASIHVVGYNNKIGQELLFMKALAPFVDVGSFINWQGEDGELWRWEFDGESVVERSAEIHWR